MAQYMLEQEFVTHDGFMQSEQTSTNLDTQFNFPNFDRHFLGE